MCWRPPTTAWLINQRHKNTIAPTISRYQERKDCLIYVSTSEKVKQKIKMPQSFLGKGLHILGYVCQQVWPPCLRSLISSKMFLTHTESSSAQIISPSSVKSFQFSALTSEASSPSRKPLWINVSSTTFKWITDPSPSLFGSRLTEYFPHLYSIISLLLFSLLSVSHFSRP